ncbi:MAG TPA: alpha/beta hydrolase [Alphaproteobacteria bacterium]|nr:alpha/beta hydrolase [Alphaproteobacteria bacterium]
MPVSAVNRRMRTLARCLALVTSLALPLLAACAPRFIPMGPPVTAPHIDMTSAAGHQGFGEMTMADGTQLSLRSWLPKDQPKAVIVALHGFNDYSNAFDMPGAYWAERGVATYAYDQRGFGRAPDAGRWADTATYIDDLRSAAKLLRARHPGLPLFVLGESMGGAITMMAMTDAAPPDVDGVILVAPAVWDRSHMPFYQTWALWIASNTVPWMALSAKGLDIMPSDNIDMLRKLSADPLVIKSTRVDAIRGLVDLMDDAFEAAPKLAARTLMLYGSRDEVVPEAPSLDVMSRLPRDGKHQFALYGRGFHMLLRDLQAQFVWDDVLAWIATPAGKLPSGADAAADARVRGPA